MGNPNLQNILALHDEYVRLTGFSISILGREHAWWEWDRRGLTVADLRALVAEKRRRIKLGELPPASMTFRNLVANVDYAEEDIAELRARRRVGPPLDPNKASLLRQTGRSDIQGSTVRGSTVQSSRPASEVIAKLTSDPTAAAKALAEFKAMKDRL